MAVTSNRSGKSIRAAIASLFFAIPLVHLLALNLKTGGSLWDCLADRARAGQLRQEVSSAEATFQSASRGGNLALHFAGFDPARANLIAAPSRFYYRAVYTLYPRRVFVGDGARIINSTASLLDADVLPGDNWLRGHGVAGVLQIDVVAGQLQFSPRAIP